MKSFPGFDHLYEFGTSSATRYYVGSWGLSSEEAVAFSRCEATPQTPIRITWLQGSGVPSGIISAMGVLIVHQRVVDLLMKHEFSGWHAFPVTVVDKPGNIVPGYHGIGINGRCGPVDLSRSEIMLVECPGGMFPCFKGRFFDPGSWDGSDLFMEARDHRSGVTMHRCMTAPVMQALKKAKIGNLCFARLSGILTDTAIFGIGKPYLLPANFADRLRALYAKEGRQVPDSYSYLLKTGFWSPESQWLAQLDDGCIPPNA